MADGDAERTRLANERTYLAWWRTGIAGIAAGFAVGRIVPEVVEGQSWPYVAVGAALTATGVLAFVYGAVRYRELDAALREGREPAPHDGACSCSPQSAWRPASRRSCSSSSRPEASVRLRRGGRADALAVGAGCRRPRNPEEQPAERRRESGEERAREERQLVAAVQRLGG